ncbi:MAG TPA: acetylxylan esterase [Mucilaginibacter sp.]|jgi:dienelactone hydrolase|nr:acetylxylan esterase [Mucilaginibacter sp.]
MKKALLIVFCLFTIVCKAQIKGTIWDVKGIYDTPQYKTITTDSAIGIIYRGLTYKGRQQNVFAYYATPGTLSGDRSKDKDLPAVILVHGGGGLAYKEWAIMWAKKGYAALAMDLRGNGPDKKHIEGGFDEPNAETPYFTITPDINEQWMFQAVANVILANNLVRSFPEVDVNRTAVTGISWGGIITCIIAGIDQRYKAAVPVYGCGYLLQNSSMRKGLLQLNDQDKQTWVKEYEPSNYIGKTKMPVLFLNGANDPHFYLDSYAKTYRLVKNKNLCIKTGLKHSHHYGWANNEIFAFINSYINHSAPLAVINQPKYKGDLIVAKVRYQQSLSKALLNFTTDTTSVLMNRKWDSMPAALINGQITVPKLPMNTTIWYFSLTDENGLLVSGPLQFIDPKL